MHTPLIIVSPHTLTHAYPRLLSPLTPSHVHTPLIIVSPHTLTHAYPPDYCLPSHPHTCILHTHHVSEIPEELRHAAQGGEVDVDLQDKRAEPYSRPKPKLVAFSGEGHKLGRYGEN